MRMYRASGRIACSMAVVALALGSSAGGQAPSGTSANADWPLHNLDNRNSRYAPLDEINASNVARLAVKWSYDAGAVDSIARNNPLVVDGVMYVDAGSKLFAVDAATGRLIWNVQVDPPFPATGRGPIYGDGKIYAYGQSILYAVDAKTGRIVESFANKGRLEIGRAALQFKYPDKDPTGYQLTASPAYFNGTLYLGLAQSEHHIPGGLVAAVDGKTGAIKWVFNTVPQGPDDDGWPIASSTWSGGARAGGGIWSPPAIDTELGLIYVNAGNPSPDYDGSARKGMNLFTNSILALNLQTGKLAWHYQTIHHEIWDFDLVTGPMLFDVTIGGRDDQGRRIGEQELSLVPVAPRDGPTHQPDGRNTRGDRDRRSGRRGVADAAVPVHGQRRADAALLLDVSDGDRSGTGQARTAALHAVLDQRDVHRLARRVELRADVVQSPNRFAVRDREERRGRAIGEAGRRYAAPEHPVAWPLRQHCGRTAALEGCRDGRHGNGDGLSPRQRRGGVAEGTPDPIGHWQFGKHCHRRRPGVSGQRHGRFLRLPRAVR